MDTPSGDAPNSSKITMVLASTLQIDDKQHAVIYFKWQITLTQTDISHLYLIQYSQHSLTHSRHLSCFSPVRRVQQPQRDLVQTLTSLTEPSAAARIGICTGVSCRRARICFHLSLLQTGLTLLSGQDVPISSQHKPINPHCTLLGARVREVNSQGSREALGRRSKGGLEPSWARSRSRRRRRSRSLLRKNRMSGKILMFAAETHGVLVFLGARAVDDEV